MLWVLIAGIVAPARAAAHAPRPSSVEKLAADATQAYRAGDFAKAVELLERAYQLQPVSAILYNLAKAYEKEGDHDHALDRYQRYLTAEDADPKLKARAEAHIAALKETAPQVGKTPHQMKPPSDDRSTAAPPVEPPPPPPVVVLVRPSPSPVDDHLVRASRERRRDRAVAIGVGAVGVIALAAAIGLSVHAQSLHDDFQRTLVEDDKRALRDSAQTQALAADCLYAAGAVAVGVGAYFLYRGLRPLPPRRAALSPWLGPRAGGLVVEGRF